MNIAIIPARGGSKRIPRKNIKKFCGKPIIAYSIEAALKSSCFDKVIVSTDDEEIADVAKFYGAEVPFIRPSKISNDYATTLEVIAHALYWYEQQGYEIEAACCIYATAPFIRESALLEGHIKLQHDDVEFVVSAALFSFPIQRAINIDEAGKISMRQPEHALSRSQDLELSYHDAGQFFWGKKTAILENKPLFADHSRIVLLPREHVQDIDTLEDWNFAELLFQATTEE